MSQFFNQMVITCDRDDKMQFAGIEQKFKRPMMIHSAGAGDSIRIAPPVTMMFQSTVQKREKNAAYAQAKREGYAVCEEEVKVPLALCEFYRFQKELTEKEPLVITVDTTRKATEVAELRTTKYMTSLEQAERIKFGTDELVEGMKRAICANMYARKASAYTLKMLEEQIEQSAKDSLYCFIHTRKSKAKVVLTSPGTNYKYQFSIRRQEYTDLLKESMEEVVAVVKRYIVHHPYWTRKKCKLILSGELYISEDAIHILEEELEEVDELYGYKLLHYKPKEAAVLGGTLICKKLLIDYGNYEIKGEVCYASEKMGAIRSLNQTQREVYYNLLDALLTGKEKFQMDDVKILPYDQTEDGQTDKGENGSGENGSDQDSTQMDLIPVKLNMVCSRSYGIGAFVHADKIMVCNVIFRNEAVPTVRETHSFVTSKDGMSECDFPIYESTRNERYVELSEAEKIGMCTLKIKGNLPKGTPLFVRVEAGIDGVLHFTGREESGNTEITAEFKTKTLLTEEELETAKQVVDDVYAKVV